MGGLRGDSLAVCFKLLCSDDECGRFLGYRGEHKRRCLEDFRVDIRVSAKRPGSHDGGARCISLATPDNRSGLVLAVEHVSGMLADARPETLAQMRFIVSEHQAEAVFHTAAALGIAVQELGPACAGQLVQPGERVLEVATNPAYVRLAMVACAEAAWDCGGRMLPVPEQAAAPHSHPAQHHYKGLLDQVPLMLPPSAAAAFAIASSALQQDSASPASSDTTLAPAAALLPQPPQQQQAGLRFRLLVAQDAVGHLLSRQGAAVCRLQAIRDSLKATGCRVRLHDRPKEQPKTSLRCLEVTGGTDLAEQRAGRQPAAVTAVLRLWAQLQQAQVADDQPLSLALAVPRGAGQARFPCRLSGQRRQEESGLSQQSRRAQGGAVIGHGGEVIRGIREASRALVRVIPLAELPGVTAADAPAGVDVASDECVLLEGPPAAVDAALQAVLGHLAHFQAANPHSHAAQPPRMERRIREVSPDSGAKRLREEVASNSPIVGPSSKRPGSHLSPKRGIRAAECAVLMEVLLTNKQKNALLECKDGELPALEAVRRHLARLALPAHIKLDDARRPDGLRRLEIGGPERRTVTDATNYLNCLLEARGHDCLPPLADTHRLHGHC